MPEPRAPSPAVDDKSPRTPPVAPAASPGLSPLVPVLAPLVLTAIVLGFVFTRYASTSRSLQRAPLPRFTDVTDAAGIRFVHDGGGKRDDTPTTLSGGVAVLDYDRDGAPDLFFVNGAPWPWNEAEGRQGPCALLRNLGDGRFVDVTKAARVGLVVQGMGVSAGDYDNDGWPDLFVTAVGANTLLHNRGDGTFEDVSAASGVAGDGHTWSTGALWLDLDGDGRLDLIASQYARWPREIELDVAFKIAGVGRSYGAPAGFVTASPAAYRNLGDGKFEDATERFGFRNLSPDTRLPRAEMIGATAYDHNSDGLLDVLFLYHNGEPTLYLNQGRGSFVELMAGPGDRQEGSAASLLAPGGLARARGRDSPGALEVLRTVDGPAAPGDGTVLRLPGRLGAVLIDYDLDGRLDIFSGGGKAEPGLNRFDSGRPFDGAPALYWNHGDGWVKADTAGAADWDHPRWTRGMAVADFDADGDEDVVLSQHGGAARLLRNDQRASAAWLKVRLQGRRSNRDGIGARVEVHTPRQRLTRVAAPPVSYLSQSDNVLTFGLGEDARVRRVVVLWPSGMRQEIVPTGINRVLTIVEEGGKPE